MQKNFAPHLTTRNLCNIPNEQFDSNSQKPKIRTWQRVGRWYV